MLSCAFDWPDSSVVLRYEEHAGAERAASYLIDDLGLKEVVDDVFPEPIEWLLFCNVIKNISCRRSDFFGVIRFPK